jgi:uncharacterized membrane protein YhhN
MSILTPGTLPCRDVTTASLALFAVCSVAAVANWVSRARALDRLEYVTKPATLLFLIGVALTLDPADPAQRAWFVVALACCLAGDVLLMLPRDRFTAGLTAFLAGHLAYVGGFLAAGLSAVAVGLATVAVVVVFGPVAWRLLARVRAGPQRRLLAPVVAYIAVIAAMVVAALASGHALAAAGGLLFLVSDTMIGWRRFVRAQPWMPVAIMVTYHTGQWGLVWSLLGY